MEKGKENLSYLFFNYEFSLKIVYEFNFIISVWPMNVSATLWMLHKHDLAQLSELIVAEIEKKFGAGNEKLVLIEVL